MGAWGTGIFQDDEALDVRDTYTNLLKEFDDATALVKLRKEMEEKAGKESVTFLLSLALTQHKIGRLDDAMLKRVLYCIDSGEALEDWIEYAEESERERTTKSRAKVLQKTREILLSPQPPRKKLAWKKEYDHPLVYYPWEIGRLYSFLGDSGYYYVFQVIDIQKHSKIRHPKYIDPAYPGDPMLLVSDYRKKRLPTAQELKAFTPVLQRMPELTPQEREEFNEPKLLSMSLYSKKDRFPEEKITRLECLLPLPDTGIWMGEFANWPDLEAFLEEEFDF